MVNPNLYSAVQKVTTTIHYDDFAGVPVERCLSYESARFSSLGHEWCLELLPGGLIDTGMISVYLAHFSNKEIKVKIDLIVNGCAESELESHTFQPGYDDPFYRDFELSKIMDSLVDGALFINVHIELADPPTTTSPAFVPENPLYEKIRDVFMDEESADIVFEVQGQRFNDDTTKKAKTSPVRFPAHQLILRKCSSTIFKELCGSAGDKTTSPIHISNVSPDVFHHLLFHLYGGEIGEEFMKSHAKEILDAADTYGVADLKLAAEACLVETTAFTTDNLMDLLLFADSKNCALLKEAAIDFMLENKGEVRQNISFNDAPRALSGDILAALERKEMDGGPGAMRIGDDRWNASAMRINDLRWHASNNGLDVDGSRETLIAALEGFYDKKEAEVDSDEESGFDTDEE